MGTTNKGKKLLPYARFVLSTLLVLFFVAGCAEKGPILLDIEYQRPAGKIAVSHNVIVGVSPFRDSRGQPPSLLGKRSVASGLENQLVTEGTVGELVTAKLKDALKARGLTVKDVRNWGLTAESMPADGYDVLISGDIKQLWLESTSVPFKTNLKCSIQLQIVAGDTAEKKIIRLLDINSKIDQDILYSREKLSEVLSEALSSALDQLFQDEVLRKKLSLSR